MLVRISPFFFLSIGVASYAKALGVEYLIANIFTGSPTRMIILAALFRALSPFCLCGVIPLVVGLLAAGVPLAKVMAFQIVSPLMVTDVHHQCCGHQFAVHPFQNRCSNRYWFNGRFFNPSCSKPGRFSDPLRIASVVSCCAQSCRSKPAVQVVNWKPWQEQTRRNDFTKQFKDNGWFQGRWLTIAFLIKSLMGAYVPPTSISEWLGSGDQWTILLAVIIGIQTYLNGFAAVPVVANLIDMGMIPGAEMAFMIGGGETTAPSCLGRIYPSPKATVYVVHISVSFGSVDIRGFIPSIDWIILSHPIPVLSSYMNETP